MINDRHPFFCPVGKIPRGQSLTAARFPVWNRHDGEPIDSFQFRLVPGDSSRHPTQPLILLEISLSGNASQRPLLPGDVEPFFHLDGLMQTVAPTSVRENSPGVFVDELNSTILNNVMHVPLQQMFCTKCLFDVNRPGSSQRLRPSAAPSRQGTHPTRWTPCETIAHGRRP